MKRQHWTAVAAAIALAVGVGTTLLAQTMPAAKTGSISGSAVDKDGKPAANAAVSYTTAPAAGATAPAMGGGRGGRGRGRGTPGGNTDDKGAFTIKDVPVGSYNVTVTLTNPTDNSRQRGATTQPVEVKDGAESKIAAPIKLMDAPAGRGGGGE